MLPAQLRNGPQPHRSSRGFAVIVVPTNFGTVALLNNSSGAEVLAVWVAQVSDQSLAAGVLATQFGFAGTAKGAGVPLVTGDAAHAGALFTADLAGAITPDYSLASFQQATNWIGLFPLVYLQPGWALVAQADSTNKNFAMQFVWEAIPAAELLPREEPEIIVAETI